MSTSFVIKLKINVYFLKSILMEKLNAYMYMNICMYVCMYVCIGICIYIHACMYMYLCYVYVYMGERDI